MNELFAGFGKLMNIAGEAIGADQAQHEEVLQRFDAAYRDLRSTVSGFWAARKLEDRAVDAEIAGYATARRPELAATPAAPMERPVDASKLPEPYRSQVLAIWEAMHPAPAAPELPPITPAIPTLPGGG